MLAKKIKEQRQAKGLTLEALAELVGTSRQTIHRYENGIITNIPPEKVEALAKALDTTPQSLMGWESVKPSFEKGKISDLSVKRLPMLGEIACGVPIYANQEHEMTVPVDESLGVDFCLRAHGDSMIGARIFDGDIVFIRYQDSVDNGEIAAVIINDEATLKRVYYYPNESKLILSAENAKYAPLVYVDDELDSIKILGKAIAFHSRIV